MPDDAPDWTPTLEPFTRVDLLRPSLLVHFGASWNKHDRDFALRVEALREEFAKCFYFAAHDVDQPFTLDLVRECKVLNVPALAFFSSGKHVETSVGIRELEALRAQLSSWALDYGPARIGTSELLPPSPVRAHRR